MSRPPLLVPVFLGGGQHGRPLPAESSGPAPLPRYDAVRGWPQGEPPEIEHYVRTSVSLIGVGPIKAYIEQDALAGDPGAGTGKVLAWLAERAFGPLDDFVIDGSPTTLFGWDAELRLINRSGRAVRMALPVTADQELDFGAIARAMGELEERAL